jgi:hypothetical protein
MPQDSDLRMTTMARTNSNCKRQTHPLVRKGAQHQQNSNCLTVTKIWSWAPDGNFTRRQTGRLTVGLTQLSLELLSQLRVAAVERKKLVSEAGDSSGPQNKGNVRRRKPLPSNDY